ncbi:MAG: putative toxin-antitoxin system toxin component, PIN family [bacterium]|nr:putative toxin-antitoxin system toxin component, PIN family [bacterium]
MFKVVLDTNILISGFISPKSHPAKIIDLWQEGKFILIVSRMILEEVKKVFCYPKISKTYHLDEEKINEYLNGLLTFSEICEPTEKLTAVKIDPADDKFIETAIAGEANFIVTGDHHLLAMGEYEGVRITTARDFCEIIKNQRKNE